MPLYAYNTTVDLSADPVTLNSYDIVQIGLNGYVFSQSIVPMFTTNDLDFGLYRISFSIQGTLASYEEAIDIGSSDMPTGAAAVRVAATGVVDGWETIRVNGAQTSIQNDGMILGQVSGVRLVSTDVIGATRSMIVNTGLITAGAAAIVIESGTGGEVMLINSGQVGQIDSADAYHAQDSSAGIDTIRNSGLMIGAVNLGGGDDTYDGRGGQVIGTVFGDSGTDWFTPGDEVDRFNGGADGDWLDFRPVGGSGIRVALDGGFENSGAAEGDSLIAIENIIGTRNGADVLRGTAAANKLLGLGGNDRLLGLGGADRLEGGQGIDTLTGGLGNDQFLFRAPAEGGDIITDFGSDAGNNDLFLVLASGFAGLTAGALDAGAFVARADNVAQTADQRFIFRTADAALWWDEDGTGAVAAVLLADLQAGTALTAADFLIV